MEKTQRFIIGFIVIMVATTTVPIDADVVCGNIIPKLIPCLGYLTAPGPAQPSLACCSASVSIAKIALQSQANLRGICTCFESVANSGTIKINFGNAKAITKLCRLPINIPIDPHVNCKALTLPKKPPAQF